MKPVKLVILAAAAVTILSVFAFPYLAAEGIKLTLWDLRKLDVIHGYIILAAMALPVVFGALAVKNNAMPRWQAIVSVLAFTVGILISIAVFSKAHASFGKDGGLGAKLGLIAMIAGGAASLVGSIKPDRGGTLASA